MHLLDESQCSFSQVGFRLTLKDLVSAVRSQNEEAIAVAVVFLESNSLGLWHNRARAALCRQFKRSPPNRGARIRIANAIAGKLLTGRIDEQFKDQLRFTILHAPDIVRLVCYQAAESEMNYVRQYASWTLDRLKENAKE